MIIVECIVQVNYLSQPGTDYYYQCYKNISILFLVSHLDISHF